jgi:excisionase family DNA binding protein
VNAEEETFTPQEAANRFGINIRTLREWIKTGKISTIKIGNRHRISRTEIETILKNLPSTAKVQFKLSKYVHGFEVPANFDLVDTYEELSQYTEAFAIGDIPFLLLAGSPGSGKSRHVKTCLGESQHKWIDNHATNLGLYCSVYGANNSPIVLDDINHLFNDRRACSLMKALTQTEKVRSVSWESTTKVLEKQKVPKQFETSSPICIIANRWDGSDADMAAIQDRALPVAFYPSAETIHHQVKLQEWCDDEVWGFVGTQLHRIPQPSMREYYNGMTYKKAGMKWRDKLLKLWEVS